MKLRGIGIAAIGLYLVLAILQMRTLLPWCDEGWFSDPALNLISRGAIANTVLDPTAEWRQVRLEGIDRHAYWIMPLYVVAQAAWYKLVGFGLFRMRALSVLLGLGALGAWFCILRRLAEDRGAAWAGLGLLAVDFHFVWSAGAGRMDMMSVALGSLGLAMYLEWRERAFERAVVAGNLAIALGCVTHPNCLIFFADMCFLTLYWDARRILRVPALALAALPYVVVLGAWAVYISQDAPLFATQFFGNAGGAGDRFQLFTQPLEALRREVGERYMQQFGGPPYAQGLSRIKLVVLAAYLAAAAAFFAGGDFRRSRGYRTLMGIAGIHLFLLMAMDGFKQAFYTIYVEVVWVAMFAVVMAKWWRPLMAVAVGVVVLVHLAVTGSRVLQNPYAKRYAAAAQYLEAHAGAGERVMASSEMGFRVGFTPRLIDDYRLGYRSGKRAELIVIDEARYGSWIPLLERQDPGNFEYIRTMLAREYALAYDGPGYKIYRRR